MHRLDVLALVLLFLFGFLVPYLVIKSARAVQAGARIPPRPIIFRNALIMEASFLFMALVAAGAARIDVFTPGEIRAGGVALAATTLALAIVAQQLIWRSTPPEMLRRLMIARPHDSNELGWWSLVSLAAGVVEEITYRGVLPSLLVPMITRWSGGTVTQDVARFGGEFTTEWWIAVALCSAAFVLGHHGQGAARSTFLAAFSLACHVLVRVTGTLYLAMTLHVVYDLIAGLTCIRIARRLEATAPGQGIV